MKRSKFPDSLSRAKERAEDYGAMKEVKLVTASVHFSGFKKSTTKLVSDAKDIRITVNKTDGEEVMADSGAPVDRGAWDNKLEFLLSCLSFAVGLGNIWRFPYLCYRNGGGVFLIPYVAMLLTTGLPLFFFELCLGQFGQEGPLTIWKICPLFTGLGLSMVMVAFFIGLYYNVIIAWAFFYLFSSFTASLPWASCDHWWNTEACRRFDSKNCTLHDGLMAMNGSCYYRDEVTPEQWRHLNATFMQSKLPADEYFHNFMLDISEGFHEEDGHHLQWHLSLCLILAWVVVFLGLFRGVSGMGKAVYFTALFPYCVLLILFARAVTLDGYSNGIAFYLTPKWEKLLEVKVWADAAMQIFFSLGPCWGGLITLASYNKFNNNCLRDALTITVANCLTSFFAGFVIFGIVGFMAHEMGVPVEAVAAQGAGLAFIAYPEAVARLPISPLWAILFFVMLLTLGLGSQFTIVQTVITSVVDVFELREHYMKVCVGMCVVGCSLGLSMCTKHGMYILQLLDDYSGTYSALMIGAIELTVVCWVYGIDNFMEDIKKMLGDYPTLKYYWKATWCFLTPLSVVLILVFTFVDYSPSSYGHYAYPTWANVLGWSISFTCIAAIPIRAVILVSTKSGPVWARITALCRPTAGWGPPDGHKDGRELPPIDSRTPLALEDEEYEMEPESSSQRATRNWSAQADEDDEEEEEEEEDGLHMKLGSRK
ncbi:sodium- and chloride-dependent glycine transporter 1 isoform X1 [Hyalella azteca]|uniref:Transporter n=2 Tax=Hyalella azteca TaxID=294128 RepID=A0A979FLK3_HYAAZ|nr:sodium- and chloride-dependent glycine transporter 1 isoform X1 [Hyalella azteca]